MEVVHKRCAGLDVHKKRITACFITPTGKELRTFGATTYELLAMADWLVEQGVTHVATESAGVYWKPVYNLLEGFDLEPLLVNALASRSCPAPCIRDSHCALLETVPAHAEGGAGPYPERTRDLARRLRSNQPSFRRVLTPAGDTATMVGQPGR
jgi:hypothetical protein